MPTLSPYQQLRRESLKTGYPLLFQTDLTVHDKWYLRRRRRPARFGWLLREHGTDLLLNCTWSEVFIEYYGPQTACYWYWFDGVSLRPTTPAELRALLAEEPPLSQETYPNLFVKQEPEFSQE